MVNRKTMLGILTALALFGTSENVNAKYQVQIDPLTNFISKIIDLNSQTTTSDLHKIQRMTEKTGSPGSVITSYYGHGEKLNAHTSNGERFNPNGLTAAHRTLPLGTRLLVSVGGRSVVVRVNDRGPAAWTGRSLDLSYGAARALGIVNRGVAKVQIARVQ